MKRLLATTLTVASLTITAELCLADTGTARVNAFIRQAPSVEAPAIGSVQKGVALEYSVVPSNVNWVKVQYKGKEGYMGRSILTPKVLTKQAAPTVVAPKHASKVVAEDGAKLVPVNAPIGPAVTKTPIFEIVQDVSTEELRLQVENAKQAIKIKEMEVAVAEITSLKKEVASLKQEIQVKTAQVEKYHVMFPYIQVIESVENQGKDVLLSGIGKARMFESGKRVVVRLEGEGILAGERLMKSVAKERYQTGNTESIRVYYVLNSQSVKNTN
jgi:uncharacterized protein YgiM (DUF1202 family)